ncbi:Lrp/AsnC family transcriptional regulator [Leucobacter viscericola]|uniref:Lrp/AsnC family transcriptional regulator n=1 Tax=Leucobacter viscericola TaxID=2714935 RepID=A0A6G7XG56_9MICO|nr:Lrp/AsnC family transcriptional regulator [Leucobacter viscericola]QIK63533.1 Lrp/AsnC family transcriptional regulator [Leucobacter viscericola]
MSVDDIDRAILEVLREDARVSMTSLAEAVHISRAGAHARVKRLVDSGVIVNFTVQTDPVRAGAHASAYVTLQIDQTGWKEIRSTLGAIEEVEHIALVGGEFDVLLLVRADDNSHLRRVVLEGIQKIPWVRSSRTILIFEDFPGGVPEE